MRYLTPLQIQLLRNELRHRLIAAFVRAEEAARGDAAQQFSALSLDTALVSRLERLAGLFDRGLFTQRTATPRKHVCSPASD